MANKPRLSRARRLLALLRVLRGARDAPGDGANLRAYCATFADGGQVYFLAAVPPDMNGLRIGDDGTVLPRVYVVKWPLYVALRLDGIVSIQQVIDCDDDEHDDEPPDD